MDGAPSKIEPNRKRQKTGGRKKGSLNKVTKDIKALAQPYGPAALKTLDQIRKASESDAARVAAARELLDRGYGKAAQSVEVSGTLDVALTLDRTIAAMRDREERIRAAR